MRKSYAAVLLVAALGFAGCGTDEPEPTDPKTSTTPTESESTQGTSAPTSEATTQATGNEPTVAPLQWQDTGVDAKQRVTKSGPWTLTVDEEGSLATLDGPEPTTIAGSKRFKVKDALLSTDGTNHYAVVVLTDTLEEKPAKATILDLASGTRSKINENSDVPPATGGDWDLSGSTLAYPTVQDGAYCLATTDLVGSEPGVAWCAAERHGFNNIRVTPTGVALMEFDDSRPSCRQVGLVGDDFTAIEGPQKCKAWEVVPFESLNVWSEIPKDNQMDAARIYANGADASYDLGPGTSGTLTYCGGAAYWVRDPQADDQPARLMRFTDAAGFEVVYESKSRGNAFLSAPRCGGDTITLTSFGDQGDSQVFAPL